MLDDLAERFSVSTGFLSPTFTTWILLMERELELLCPCPSRELIAERLPEQFADFVNIRMIIDCTEVFIQCATVHHVYLHRIGPFLITNIIQP